MPILCDYATKDEFGRVICTGNENCLCAFQRFCANKIEWENSKDYYQCKRRKDLNNQKNRTLNSNEKEEKIETKPNKKKNSVTKNVKTEQKKEISKKDCPKKKGTVICVLANSIIVNTDDNKGYTLYGYPDAKIGDIIEF